MIEQSSDHVAIAGTGAVARTFGRLLALAGEEIYVISRDPARAQAAAEYVGRGAQAATYSALSARVSKVLIAVPDRAVGDVAGWLRKHENIRVAIHTSGSLELEPLASLRTRGVACGSMHPLQTLAGTEADLSALRGVAFAVAGDEKAQSWAAHIVSTAGGEMLEIAPALKPLYHAAAVFASNYIAALLDASETLMCHAGLPSYQARRILKPLIRSAVENTLKLGPVSALTGPIARGDLNTVASHLDALSSVSERIRGLYEAAGLQALELAQRKGLEANLSAELRGLLTKERYENGSNSN